MSINLCTALIFIFVSQCTGFDITRADRRDDSKYNFSQSVVEPALENCARGLQQWGVTSERLHRFARNPRLYHFDDNDVFDCAWACFFVRMGWLDEDIEGSFQPPVMLRHLEQYYPSFLIPRARKAASRCVYVNYPHEELSGPVPDCGQGKLLKNCLIKEEVLRITEENKMQFFNMMADWMQVCADVEGLDLAEVLVRAQHPPPAPPPFPKGPALLGCVWRCLFYDMGMMDDEEGEFEMSVVLEMIRLYYREQDKLSQLLQTATGCVYAANAMYEYPYIPQRPRGCDRSQLLVDCLVRGFVYQFPSNTWSWSDSGRARRPSARTGAPPAPHHPASATRYFAPAPRQPASAPRHPAPALQRPAPTPSRPTPAPRHPAPASRRPVHAVRSRLRLSGAKPGAVRSVALKLRFDDGIRKHVVILNKTFKHGVFASSLIDVPT